MINKIGQAPLNKRKWIYLCAFFILILFIVRYHYLIQDVRQFDTDDAYYRDYKIHTETENILEYSKHRYEGWTGRTLLEAVVILFTTNEFWIWQVADILCIALLGGTIIYLFSNKRIETILLTAFMIPLYPFNHMRECGYMCDTVIYLWPLTFLLLAFFPIKKVAAGLKLKWYEYPIYILSALYACNQEQTGAIFLVIYLVFFIYFVIKKKNKAIITIQCILGAASVAYLLYSPGIHIRFLLESTRITGYNTIGFMEQLTLGINTTYSILFMRINLICLFFLGTLAVCVIGSKPKFIFKIIGGIPLIVMMGLNKLPGLLIEDLTTAEDTSTAEIFLHLDKLYLGNILGTIAIISIIISMYVICKKDWKQFILLCLIFGAGLASRIIMGFSPTIFASGLRTAIFLYFSLIISTIILIRQLNKDIIPEMLTIAGAFLLINYFTIIDKL